MTAQNGRFVGVVVEASADGLAATIAAVRPAG